MLRNFINSQFIYHLYYTFTRSLSYAFAARTDERTRDHEVLFTHHVCQQLMDFERLVRFFIYNLMNSICYTCDDFFLLLI